MKRIAFIVVVFAAGIVASIALAKPPSGAGGASSTTPTTTTGEHGHGPKSKCHPVNLRGTVSGGSFSVAVTRADPHSQNLNGTSVTFHLDGRVSIKAVACTPTGAQSPTLTLRQLKSDAKPPQSGDSSGG
jgi:hypothetical protein